MHQPLVSILIPTYNNERYIEAAIDSVREQSYTNTEIIVIDDGSTDNTPRLLETYTKEAGIVVLTKCNEGLAAARNTGLKAAKGEFIAFCDGDDLWHHDKLTLQVPALTEHPEIGIVHTARMAINSAGETIGRKHKHSGQLIIPKNPITRRLVHSNFIVGSSSLIRRACFDDIGGYNESFRLSSDHQFYLRLSMKYKFAFLDAELYLYRKHPEQITANRELREAYKEKVLLDFEANFPGAVAKQDLNHAYAKIHKTRGNDLLKQDLDAPGARREYLTALRYQPTNLSVWFKLLRSLFFIAKKPA